MKSGRRRSKWIKVDVRIKRRRKDLVEKVKQAHSAGSLLPHQRGDHPSPACGSALRIPALAYHFSGATVKHGNRGRHSEDAMTLLVSILAGNIVIWKHHRARRGAVEPGDADPEDLPVEVAIVDAR